MDSRFVATREDLYNLQMELKQMQYAQNSHAERLTRLEKRQADDAALKSVWNSPFPGVLAGTPQQDPVNLPSNVMFEDLDVQGDQLLGSLHLGPTEEEPIRRGAASRANSVRFDESALQGSSWGGQNNRHSGDFGPVRPGSSLMMERTLSHKSDGRHSSAGHSVHSHHSAPSGRASSLGLDTNFAVGDDDDSDSFDMPGLPASFYVLGSVPSIVRCWLTRDYAHATLLYADICTGSQRSTLDVSLIKELGLMDELERDVDGVYWARLNVYFAEAIVTYPGSRNASPERMVPSMRVLFEITGTDQGSQAVDDKAIRIYIGSDALRTHSVDVLFSRNMMTLLGNDRDRVRVPFVRPEDNDVFRHISTSSMVPDKPKLNANAAPFVAAEAPLRTAEEGRSRSPHVRYEDDEINERSSRSGPEIVSQDRGEAVNPPEQGQEGGSGRATGSDTEQGNKDGSEGSGSLRRESSSGIIWGSSWRQAHPNGPEGTNRESGPLSGYQPAPRSGRNMKVLKPNKAGSSSVRTGSSYEPPSQGKSGVEIHRKSHNGGNGDNTGTGPSRWDSKRVVSSGSETGPKSKGRSASRERHSSTTAPRSANPVGIASAFSWMTPPGKPKRASNDS